MGRSFGRDPKTGDPRRIIIPQLRPAFLSAVIVLASVLLLRRSDWNGWPGLVTFAVGMAWLLYSVT